MTQKEKTDRDYRRSFRMLDLDGDPFAHTNADEEDRLSEYFIPPPYFTTAFGNPEHPKTFVIFAPRGGGKSAQRRMMEERSGENDILPITYDQFEFAEIQHASEIKLYHHLQRIIRIALMGVLVSIHSEPALIERLQKHDREILVRLSAEHLKGVSEYGLKKAVDSLKSLKDKVQDFWNEWLPAIGPGLSILIKKLTNIDLDSFDKYDKANLIESTYLKYELELIINIARKLGFKAIYVLIDRVDEAELTGNDAPASFDLVKPLLKDLHLLEFDGLAFKFFLWDQLEPAYLEIARTDRIRHETLEWTEVMLRDLWQKRLRAFSSGKLSSLNEKSEPVGDFLIDELALIFANHSPRDMIRIGAQIISEQQEIELFSSRITTEAIERGIEKFCSRRAMEIISDKALHDLKKVQEVDFTIPHIASNVFREKQTNTRNRIHKWRKEGIIVDIDTVANPNPQKNKPVKLMGIRDIRVGKTMNQNMSVLDFLNSKYKRCPGCGNTVLRDWGTQYTDTRCNICKFDLLEEKIDDIEVRKREEIARQVRRLERKDLFHYSQMPLFPDSDYEEEDD